MMGDEMTLAILQIIKLMSKPVCRFCLGVLESSWNFTLNQGNGKDEDFR